jgi:ABC-2 type transport system permease protein
MNDIPAITYSVLHRTKNRIKEILRQPVLKILFIGACALAFWVGLYFIFYYALKFITAQPYYSQQLVHSVIYLLFFILFIMLVFSNGIISYISLFKVRENEFLLSGPVRLGTLFSYKLLDSLSFSSWAFMFLAFPLVFAIGIHYNLGIAFYIFTFLIISVFILLPAIIGAIISLLLARFFPRAQKKIGSFILILLIALAIFIVFHFLSLKAIMPMGLRLVIEVFDRLSFSRNPLLPSFWVSKGIISLMQNDYSNFVFFLSLILSNILFLLMIGLILMDALYVSAWNATNAHLSGPRRFKIGLADLLFLPFKLFIDKQSQTMIKKDLRCFLRDPVQWTQFLLFIGILAFYFLNLRLFEYEKRELQWRLFSASMNVFATALTLSTFTSRFIFPQFSLEGRRFWILGASPVNPEKILTSKFVLSFLYTLLIGEILILISSFMLEIPVPLIIVYVISIFGLSLGLSGLAMGLGTIYPSFSEDNPSKIVSGFGGTLNLILSLVLVVVIISAQFIPGFLYFIRGGTDLSEFYATATIIVFGIIIVCTLACVIPLSIGFQKLKTLEI